MKWRKTLVCAVLNILLHMAVGLVESDTKCCQPQGETTVYESVTDWSCYNANWDLKDATIGQFSVRFNFPKREHSYTARLYVNDNITSREQCETSTRFDTAKWHWQTHTPEKTLQVEDWSDANCNKNTTCDKVDVFNFLFIFKGCYQLNIRLVGDPVDIQICPIFLDAGSSGYRKKLLMGDYTVQSKTNPNFASIVQLNLNEYPWNEIWLIESNVTLELRQMFNGRMSFIAEWEVNVKPNKQQVSCFPEDPEQPRLECDISSRILEMRLVNIEPGQYRYKISLSSNQDVRCSLSTLWSDSEYCRWAIIMTVDTKNDTKTKIETDAKPALLTICVPILAGVFVVLIFTLIATKYTMKNKPLTVPVEAPITVSVIDHRPAILLLYSRDCDAFMELMKSFRQLLEENTALEIYDCFDSNRRSEVSLDPSAWMRGLVSSRKVRVIAVASHCARLRQRAHLDRCTVQFSEPKCTDKLFEHGLQLLTDAMALNASYKHTFVARVDGFSDDKDLFLGLNSYTRFVLPLHLDKLLRSLIQSTTNEEESCLTMERGRILCENLNNLSTTSEEESCLNTEKGRILCENLNKLKQFKQENPDYLKNLLLSVEPPTVNV